MIPKNALGMAKTGDEPAPGEVVDEASLRALAHPIRWALIETLSVEGTATAARCAEIVGESHASCSFHLRQLARFGIVEQAPTTSRRDRPWRLTSVRQSWSAGPTGDPARDRAAQELSRVFVQRETERIRRWVSDRPTAPAKWRRAAFQTGVLTWLTPAELDGLGEAISALMQTYAERIDRPEARPSAARPVRLFTVGFPVFELGPQADRNAARRDVGTS
jgi:hypothetical protein